MENVETLGSGTRDTRPGDPGHACQASREGPVHPVEIPPVLHGMSVVVQRLEKTRPESVVVQGALEAFEWLV